MKCHRFAEFFPLLEGPSFDALSADIAAHGQREPVVIFGGEILDGRNRWRACVAANLEPQTTTFHGTDEEALALVISTNLHRRHLDESQRAMVAARIANMRQGDNRSIDPLSAVSQPAAAEQCNVSVPSLKRAAVVIAHGAPELVRAVEAGDVAVSAAAAVARLPEEEQRAVVAQGGGAVATRAKEERERSRATSAPLASAMTGAAPPVALMPTTNLFATAPAVNDDEDTVEHDVLLNDESDDDAASARGPLPGWSPPLHTSLANNDEVFAAGELAAMMGRWRAELGSRVDGLSPSARETVLRRVEPHFISLVADVLDRLPWLKGAAQARVSLQLIPGGRP